MCLFNLLCHKNYGRTKLLCPNTRHQTLMEWLLKWCSAKAIKCLTATLKPFGASKEPNRWHSFQSVTGSFANSAKTDAAISSDQTRPGSTGKSSVLIKSREIGFFFFSVIANGHWRQADWMPVHHRPRMPRTTPSSTSPIRTKTAMATHSTPN